MTPTFIVCQTKDTVYKYDICVHQKSQIGKVYSAYLHNIVDRELSSIHIEIWDNKKNKVIPAIIHLNSIVNDSISQTISLDTCNTYDFVKLLPGNYNVKVQSLPYQSLQITNVPISETKCTKLYFELGQPDAFIQMTIKSNKKLSPRQLRKHIAKTEKELNK